MPDSLPHDGERGATDLTAFAELIERLRQRLFSEIDHGELVGYSRRQLARAVSDRLDEELAVDDLSVSMATQRDLVTAVLNRMLKDIREAQLKRAQEALEVEPEDNEADGEARGGQPKGQAGRALLDVAMNKVQPVLMDRLDVAVAASMSRGELTAQIGDVIAEILSEHRIQLNRAEQRQLTELMLNEMTGLGPLEPLLADEAVTDIMVNGPKQIYVERKGKLEVSGVTFRDNAHVMHVATRIVTRIGRRIDESSPLVDARLEDGSRVNIIIPPLAIDGPSISIRKFAKKSITLDTMARQRNASPALATVLKIASRCRLNVVISGGTGSGKTTLLNAMSRMIDHGERIVTIEDAAELQLQQPHVVRLETRPSSLEGTGEITMRDLVKNALRMRPDRIILGEVRGSEALDMLQAMNTGHDGSMCTIHANNPREALTRMENMVAMAGFQLPAKAVRTQISDAVDLIVQVSRMRDGVRRITRVTEIVGMEGDIVTTQDLFKFVYTGESHNGTIEGRFESTGLRPNFMTEAEYFGLHHVLSEAMASAPEVVT